MIKNRFAFSVFTSVLFLALLTWPVLGIVNNSAFILGMPRLFIYLFAVCAALVLLVFLLTRSNNQPEE